MGRVAPRNKTPPQSCASHTASTMSRQYFKQSLALVAGWSPGVWHFVSSFFWLVSEQHQHAHVSLYPPQAPYTRKSQLVD
mmetsp:Transcript_9539/g.23000  ORF Transcript_9539/g.23000 Transcript_9539/m.23000 type:complete len:80 (-) Transcript_9539:553-792(-)|eukprot:7379325-Prymnesium_polylepis.1